MGSFDTDCIEEVAARLKKLVASANHLDINCHSVANIDDTVAALFRDTAASVEASGGTLDLVGLHASFVGDHTTTSTQSQPTPTRLRGT